jgi:hypothetical protein
MLLALSGPAQQSSSLSRTSGEAATKAREMCNDPWLTRREVGGAIGRGVPDHDAVTKTGTCAIGTLIRSQGWDEQCLCDRALIWLPSGRSRHQRRSGRMFEQRASKAKFERAYYGRRHGASRLKQDKLNYRCQATTDRFAAAAASVVKTLQEIDSLPVLPSEVEDLTISSRERHKWTKDGR